MARPLGDRFKLSDGTTEREAYFKMPTSLEMVKLNSNAEDFVVEKISDLAIKKLIIIDPDTKLELEDISYDILDTIFSNPCISLVIINKFVEQITPLKNSCNI